MRVAPEMTEVLGDIGQGEGLAAGVGRSGELGFEDESEFLEDFFERGWTDGLPVVPPRPAAVAEFLRVAGCEPLDVLGEVPTREVVVTAQLAAVNAVMAGCRPEYFPVVLAAVRAHLSKFGNSHCTTGSLIGPAHAVIVNGPIREQTGIASKAGCFGPGFRA